MANDNAPSVIPFKPKLVTPQAPAPDEYIVKLLEFWLKKAREGDLSFIAIATVDIRGIAHSAWAPEIIEPPDIAKALGAVAYMTHRVNTAAVDADEDGVEQPDPPEKKS